MKTKKTIFLGILLLVGCLSFTTYTTQAKIDIVTFEVLEQSVYMEIGKEWVTEDMILQWRDVYWEFVVQGDDLTPLAPLIATAEVFHFSLIDYCGGGKGTNYFYGICNIAGYEGLIIEWAGISVMDFVYGSVYGKYVSHGTLGDYKIQVRGEFFPSEIPDWTTLIGEIKIFL